MLVEITKKYIRGKLVSTAFKIVSVFIIVKTWDTYPRMLNISGTCFPNLMSESFQLILQSLSMADLFVFLIYITSTNTFCHQ